MAVVGSPDHQPERPGVGVLVRCRILARDAISGIGFECVQRPVHQIYASSERTNLRGMPLDAKPVNFASWCPSLALKGVLSRAGAVAA
jgi:hypothetical protein